MLGATMISLSPVFVRLTDTLPEVSAFYRVFFGACILLVCTLLQRRRPSFKTYLSSTIVIAGVFFAIDLACWHASINILGPGLSTLLANFQVVFLILIGLIFLKEKLTGYTLVSVPIALLGLVLILGAGDSSNQSYIRGIVFGLLAAFFYALYIICLKNTRARSDSQTGLLEELTIVCLIASAALAIYILAVGAAFSVAANDLPWLFLNGVVAQTAGWLLIASSLPYLPTSRVAMLLLLQPVLSYLWDIVIFDRVVFWPELAGATLALVAIYIGGMRTASNPEESDKALKS